MSLQSKLLLLTLSFALIYSHPNSFYRHDVVEWCTKNIEAYRNFTEKDLENVISSYITDKIVNPTEEEKNEKLSSMRKIRETKRPQDEYDELTQIVCAHKIIIAGFAAFRDSDNWNIAIKIGEQEKKQLKGPALDYYNYLIETYSK